MLYGTAFVEFLTVNYLRGKRRMARIHENLVTIIIVHKVRMEFFDDGEKVLRTNRMRYVIRFSRARLTEKTVLHVSAAARATKRRVERNCLKLVPKVLRR